MLVGCHNNAHLRTQRILKPGERVYSGSGVLAMGGVNDDSRELRETGVMGVRGEVSMLSGSEDSEFGPYLGFGASEDGPGFIAGYDYKKYVGLDSGLPKKLGTQFEVDLSEMGQVFHLRPSLTTTTTKRQPFYGGVHGILAMGRLINLLEWETLDMSSNNWDHEWHEQEIDYSFNSLGAGLTAGVELLMFNDNSFQLQVDVSLVNNSFNTDAEPPDIDTENVDWFSWENDYYEYGGDLSHGDDPILMVTGSAGISFFKPRPNTGKPLEPLPSPVQVRQPTYDPETGEKNPGELQFDPGTGELQPPDEVQFDPETGERIQGGGWFDPETGLQTLSEPYKKELAYGEITREAREAAKRIHNTSNHRLCGAGSCVFYPIGIPAAFLYVESGALSTLNQYDPFYLKLDSSQKIIYEMAYKNEEKQLRRKEVYSTQLTCVAIFFIMMLMDG